MSVAGVVRDYWVTMRPYLFFVSGTAGLAGLALGDAGSLAGGLTAFVALSVSYGLGQALTDVFQIDTDRLSSPYRPLVRGTIGRGTVLALSAVGLLILLGVLTWLSPWNGVLVCVAVAGLATYTPCKRRFWAGPLWNAWIVALIPVMGYLATGRSPGHALGDPRLRALVALSLLSYAVFVLLGYFKDIEADRASGYQTLPVRWGRTVSVAVSVVLALASVTSLAVLLGLEGSPGGLAGAGTALILTAGVALLGRAHVRMLGVRTDDAAHPAIADTVRAFVLLHVGVAIHFQPLLLAPGVVLLSLFEAALAARPERSQI